MRSIEASALEMDILIRGYAEFEHHITVDAIGRLVEAYADFSRAHPDPQPSTMDAMLPAGNDVSKLKDQLDMLDRGQDHQEQWHKYRTNVPNKAKPDGYTNRSFQVEALKRSRGVRLPAEDPKEYYHYSPLQYAAMKRMHEAMGWGAIPPEVDQLTAAFAPIHYKASELMIKICRLIEERHPEITDIVTPRSLRHSPLRLVIYHPTNNTEVYANPHYDIGVSTLQLAESHQGLRLARSNSEPLRPVLRSADKAVFFPALDIAKVAPDTIYKPVWHDVVITENLNQGRTVPIKALEMCARYALIFFTNGEIVETSTKADSHNR